MANNFNVENLTAVTRDGEYLGYLLWYSIREIDETRDDLVDKMTDRGFEKYIPKEISPSDAFRRATSNVQRKRVPTSNEDIFENYLTREVYSDNKEIVRKIIIEKVDKKGKKLEYDPQLLTITYDKKADKIEFDNPNPTEMSNLLLEEIQGNFYYEKIHYNSRHLREVIYKILQDFSPTPVRKSGGVYFVRYEFKDKVEKLTSLIKCLGESEGYKIPVINSEEQIDMVRQKLYDHIGDNVNDIADFLKKDKITKSLAKRKFDEIKKVISDFKSYQDILSLSMEEIDDRVDILKKQGRKLLEKIDS